RSRRTRAPPEASPSVHRAPASRMETLARRYASSRAAAPKHPVPRHKVVTSSTRFFSVRPDIGLAPDRTRCDDFFMPSSAHDGPIALPRAAKFALELPPPEHFDPRRLETWPQRPGRLALGGGTPRHPPTCGD